MTTETTTPADRILMSEQDAAKFLCVSRRTLQSWRVSGRGPVYRRIGERRVGYVMADLLKHLDSRAFVSTSAEDLTRLPRNHGEAAKS